MSFRPVVSMPKLVTGPSAVTFFAVGDYKQLDIFVTDIEQVQKEKKPFTLR